MAALHVGAVGAASSSVQHLLCGSVLQCQLRWLLPCTRRGAACFAPPQVPAAHRAPL